jgi:hypothetical protein
LATLLGASNGSFGVYFEHLYTGVNGVANRGLRASIPARRDWAAEIAAEREATSRCDIL